MADMTVDEFMERFDAVELTDIVTHVPDVPSLLSPFFSSEGMRTTVARIEVEKQGLQLVPDTKRNYEGPNAAPEDRHKGVYIEAAHLVQTDFVLPQDLQDVRPYGKDGLTTVDEVVTRKLARMRRNIAATLEWHRVGAVKGLVLDADVPRGYVLLTYRQVPLGFVKNIGNRANNLYPQEWRIRSGYLPEEIVCVF